MMNCIVIDDSANALELMKIHIAKIPFLKLMGTFLSVPEALETLNHEPVDLIFTDIHMPDISGMQFAKNLKSDVLIIFTTAYSEYALEGFEVNAVDYLLKPISFEKFLRAVNKALDHHKKRKPVIEVRNPKSEPVHIYLKSSGELHRVLLDDIVFLESQGNYIKTQLAGGDSIMSLMTMKEALEKLEVGKFFRCHRGFIISLDHISRISVSEVHLGEYKIPVGKSYRAELQKMIGF